jgi:hypothetical protein
MKKYLTPGERYILANNSAGYWLLPKKCNCKKKITHADARELVNQGQAEPIWKLRRKFIEIDYTRIWMAQQVMVPRVDMISPADIDRYVDFTVFGHGNESSLAYVEEVHALYMQNRQKLIVPFRPDPYGEGRTLFSFGTDQRSFVSYKDSLKGRQEAYNKLVEKEEKGRTK